MWVQEEKVKMLSAWLLENLSIYILLGESGHQNTTVFRIHWKKLKEWGKSLILNCQYLQGDRNYIVVVSIWSHNEKLLDVNLKMCKGAEYSTKFKELGSCWIPSASFLAWWKHRKRKKTSHIEMWLKCSSKSCCTRLVFSGPHSPCQLASKCFFSPVQEVLHAPPAFLSNQYLFFFPFYQIMTLLLIAAGLLDS